MVITALLLGLGLGLASLVASFCIVYTIGARRQGYRLWSARRAAALRSGRTVCIGGPMDGAMLPVGRLAITGITLGDWPDVLYDATTRHYRIGTRGGAFGGPRDCWAGYYMLRFLSDRYEWHGTQMEKYADTLAGGAA